MERRNPHSLKDRDALMCVCFSGREQNATKQTNKRTKSTGKVFSYVSSLKLMSRDKNCEAGGVFHPCPLALDREAVALRLILGKKGFPWGMRRKFSLLILYFPPS